MAFIRKLFSPPALGGGRGRGPGGRGRGGGSKKLPNIDEVDVSESMHRIASMSRAGDGRSLAVSCK
jgi:hypothetical protein